MKNLVRLVSKEEVTEYTDELWKTPEFQESAKTPGTLVHEMTRRFAQLPRLFFEYTDPKLEKFHFLNTINLIPLRSGWYNEGVGTKFHTAEGMEDIFYLHEIWHVITRDYVEDVQFPKWVQRWYENETDASLTSEVDVYFHFPTMREKTLKGEIWADRLLDETRRPLVDLLRAPEVKMGTNYPKNNREFFKQDPEMFRVFLTRLRMSILLNEEAAQDDIEKGISQWLGRNLQYYNGWRSHFQAIENRMVQFQRIAGVDREAALDSLVKWIEEEQGDDATPFQSVAEEFNASIKRAGRRTTKKE